MKLVCVRYASQLETGDMVRCTIMRRPVNECVVHKTIAAIYPCQNVIAGTDCGKRYRKGFRYSWIVMPASMESFLRALARNDVAGLRKAVKGRP